MTESEQKFVESYYCKSGAHCKACRSIEHGRQFRKSQGMGDDFECPPERGAKPWDFNPEKTKPVKAAIVARTIAKGDYDKLPEAVPFENWPENVREIGHQRTPGEAGVGDTTKRLLGETVNKAASILGMFMNCQCEERRRWLNAAYPYPEN